MTEVLSPLSQPRMVEAFPIYPNLRIIRPQNKSIQSENNSSLNMRSSESQNHKSGRPRRSSLKLILPSENESIYLSKPTNQHLDQKEEKRDTSNNESCHKESTGNNILNNSHPTVNINPDNHPNQNEENLKNLASNEGRMENSLNENQRNNPIQLLPYQIPHLKRCYQILKEYPVVLDFSRTGLGKTYTTSALAALCKLRMLVITSPTCFQVWNKIQRKHQIPIVDMVSFDILRGLSGRRCNHPYLRRDNNTFYPTDQLKSLLKEGILIVFDEISKLKNQEAGVRAAAHAMVKAVIQAKSGSRVCLLSALPCDKDEHIPSLLQMLGLIKQDRIYRYNNSRREYEITGLQEAINWCMLKDPAKTKEILSTYPTINKKIIPKIAMRLCRDIVASRLCACMQVEIDPDSQLQVRNSYYPMTGQDRELLQLGQRRLSRAVYGNHSQEEVRRSTNWGEVTKALQILGTAKLRTLARAAYHELTLNSQRKVVLCAWYVKHLKWLHQVFQPFGAKLLYGPTKTKDREKYVNLFQKPNSECRVIIVNPTVGGMAISLDDRHGKWPRTMFIVPDYRFIELVQSTGRIYRQSTKSKRETRIRFIYAQQFRGESKILDSLLRKSNHARSVISNDSGLVLPDSYHNEELTMDDPQNIESAESTEQSTEQFLTNNQPTLSYPPLPIGNLLKASSKQISTEKTDRNPLYI